MTSRGAFWLVLIPLLAVFWLALGAAVAWVLR